jgi:hypothetical protein
MRSVGRTAWFRHPVSSLMLAALCCGAVVYALTRPVPSKGTRTVGNVPAQRESKRPSSNRVATPPPPPRRELRRTSEEKKLSAKETAVEEERSLLQRLRQLEFADPAQSVRLAEAFDERFPERARAPERAWYLARNLVYLGRFDEARRVARETVGVRPDDSWSRDLARHLLSHPFGMPPRDH